LSRELLQLSKLESGKLQRRDEELRVPVVVETCLRPLQLQFREKHVSLTVDLATNLPLLVADEQQFASVLTNLVSNALKFTDPGGEVTVRARDQGACLLFEVEDTGHGIPREHLEDIFDRFVQIRQSSEATPGSVGLGLAIAKEIVEQYDGRIWAESEIERGSKFSVILPLRPAHQTMVG
jgi:signal transduction histidine kinase